MLAEKVVQIFLILGVFFLGIMLFAPVMDQLTDLFGESIKKSITALWIWLTILLGPAYLVYQVLKPAKDQEDAE